MEKKQPRTRDCNKSLFTLYCINNHSEIAELEGLFSILDNEILKTYQERKKIPTQKEIYQKYHSKAKDTCAEVRACETLKIFLADLQKYLKEER